MARSSPPAAPSLQPPGLTASRLRGALAAPRGTHLIHRSWTHWRPDCTSAPGPGGALGRRNSEPGGVCRLRSGQLPGAPRGPRAARSAQQAGAQVSGQRAAAGGALPLGAARGWFCKAGPAPDADGWEAGRARARVRVRACLGARRPGGCLLHFTQAEKSLKPAKRKENPT